MYFQKLTNKRDVNGNSRYFVAVYNADGCLASLTNFKDASQQYRQNLLGHGYKELPTLEITPKQFKEFKQHPLAKLIKD